jgi:predicted RNA-binding protein YlxR (DUF448 family)
MKTRKTPLRTCIACGRETDKRELMRIVRDPEGDPHVDPGGKAPGRGAYMCTDPACFEKAVNRRRLASALRASVTEDDVERLRNEFETAIDNDRESSRLGR